MNYALAILPGRDEPGKLEARRENRHPQSSGCALGSRVGYNWIVKVRQGQKEASVPHPRVKITA